MQPESRTPVTLRESGDGLIRAGVTTFRRELLIAFREKQDVINPLVFFVLIVSLFPLGISPETEFLRDAGAGIIWVAALLAILLSLNMLFRNDYADGYLEQWVLSPQPLAMMALVRVSAVWVASVVPLLLLVPLLGLMLHLPAERIGVLTLTLLMGSPVLLLIGAIGAALTVSVRNSGMLLALLMTPFYVPVLIFGTGAVTAFGQGASITGHLAILGAMLALAIVLAPLAIAAGLRMSVANG
ncbi:heme exporter protein B [Halospina denitrificans]|uniref:Heme exporter protein B n=1 Tax=Halospina denitrificans TaxID=332522 RepID=A0A4R7JMG7_9GAMM|nr:heme exporter protein CcmB [Halospina denitrificans]TDT39281.1 heme exporter protein B [Halospina denitrificans]